MKRVADLRGPPPLIPIYELDTPTQPLLVPLMADFRTNHQSLQPESPLSLEKKGNYTSQQSVHQYTDDKVVTLVDSGTVPNHEEKRSSSNISPNIEVRLPDSKYSSNLQSASNVEENCLADDRLKFLYEDPLLLQELVIQEKIRASGNEMDLDMYQTRQRSFQVVTFCRLRRIYQAGFLSIRLDNSKPLVLVTNITDSYRFACSSTEISLLSSDWTNVPSIVTELLSTLDVTGDPTRYTLRLYNVVHDFWELIGCLDSSFTDTAPSQTSPEENPMDFLMLAIQEEVLLLYVFLLLPL